MPKANKAVKEEDSKSYIQPEGKKAQKSPQKNSEGPWTPDQAWLLFNALYKKDKVDWKMVSEAVGRSSKSCQNGYEGLFKKRLEGIIKGSVGRSA